MEILEKAVQHYREKGYYVTAYSADRENYYMFCADDYTHIELKLEDTKEVTAKLTGFAKGLEITWRRFSWDNPAFDMFRERVIDTLNAMQTIQ